MALRLHQLTGTRAAARKSASVLRFRLSEPNGLLVVVLIILVLLAQSGVGLTA